MHCTNCGSRIADTARFCPECGHPVEENQKQNAPAPQLEPTPAAQSEPVSATLPVPKRNSKLVVTALIILAVILGIGAGSFVYFTQFAPITIRSI